MQKKELRNKKKNRMRMKVKGTSEKPRLTVYRSNSYLYAQIIDDVESKTIASASNIKEKANNVKTAEKVGEEVAKAAIKKGVKKVVFDRSGYKYHGKIKSLAEAARKAGLEF